MSFALRFILVVTVMFVLAIVSDRSEAADAGGGLSLVTEKCGPCHAVGLNGSSPHPQAPPFRDVAKRYAPMLLTEALAEGITTGHPDMPEFVFLPPQIDDIIIYLESLR
jgi:cytochrome c